MADVYAGGWVGHGVGRPVRGGCVGVLDIQFAVVGGFELVIPKACCWVSSLKRIPIR